MWILEVICVEQFTEIGKKCGFYEVFFELNFYWKVNFVSHLYYVTSVGAKDAPGHNEKCSTVSHSVMIHLSATAVMDDK
jgi:hypothetical protein